MKNKLLGLVLIGVSALCIRALIGRDVSKWFVRTYNKLTRIKLFRR